MNYSVKAGKRSGSVCVPSSKSYAHRILICSALAQRDSLVICDGISKDIEATVKCLNALGADITLKDGGVIAVKPIKEKKSGLIHLYCGESGSTLRFMIPIVGALGYCSVFHMEGKLSQRPLGALIETLSENGMTIEQKDDLLYCKGKLKAGNYHIPGNISSQFISGLLFALPLLESESTLEISGNIESSDYISMTEDAVINTGINFDKNGSKYTINGNQKYTAKEKNYVEKDWSNAAFFICMGALSDKGITLNGMNLSSKQGDKNILNIVRSFGADIITEENSVTVRKNKLKGQTVDAKAIPDLVPTICALASCAEGTTEIINAGRLRIKESDRLKTTADMLSALGADISETENGLIIKGKDKLIGGEIDASNDHRIAMAAAVAASVCEKEVIVHGAQCVSKSYPDFWEHFEKLEVLP